MKGKKLLSYIGEIDNKFIEEVSLQTESRRERKSIFRSWWLAPVAACIAVVLISTLLFTQNNWYNTTPPINNGSAPSINTPQTQLDEQDKAEQQLSAVINKLQFTPSELKNTIALFNNDFVTMSIDELTQYFDTTILPAYIPSNVNQSFINVSSYNTNFGVFKRSISTEYYEKDTVYYDQNIVLYISNDAYEHYKETGKFDAPYISVAFSKTMPIHFDIPERDDLEYSKIGSNKVLFATYEEYDDTFYIAEFDRDGVSFYIKGSGITQEDFVKTIASYFE